MEHFLFIKSQIIKYKIMEENNKMNISRRGFLKTAALAGAALAMPSGLSNVFASEQRTTGATDNNSSAAHIKGHRVLGTGKAAFEVSALGFGVMGMFIPSQAPDKDEAYQFMDYILQPENAAKCFDYIGYYSTNKAADSLLENQDLVVPDSVTEGSAVENISAEAEEAYNKNWTEFKAACD
jgi:secreted PhoX family phosphatase